MWGHARFYRAWLGLTQEGVNLGPLFNRYWHFNFIAILGYFNFSLFLWKVILFLLSPATLFFIKQCNIRIVIQFKCLLQCGILPSKGNSFPLLNSSELPSADLKMLQFLLSFGRECLKEWIIPRKTQTGKKSGK